MTARLKPDEIIRDYQAAYEASNGAPAPIIRYERGWFRFTSPYLKKARRDEVMQWTKMLLRRATSSRPLSPMSGEKR